MAAGNVDRAGGGSGGGVDGGGSGVSGVSGGSGSGKRPREYEMSDQSEFNV